VHRTIRECAPVCDFSNGERTGIDDLAALTARVFREIRAENRGRRESRMPSRTRGSCAKKSTRGSHHRFDRINPAFPARMVLTVSFELSLVIGLFVTIPGVKRQLHRRVDLSIERPGPHDFAVRERCRSSFGTFASIATRARRS
jgi:hypothetical protein